MKFLRQPLALLAFGGILLGTNVSCRADDAFPLDGAQLAGSQATQTAQGLKIDFGNKDAWPNINWKAPSDAGWDWSSHSALVLTLNNPTNNGVSFHVKIGDHDEGGKRHSTQLSGNIEAGKTERFYVSLESRTLREKSGMRYLPPVQGDYGTLIGSGVEPRHIDSLQIFRAMPKETATVILQSIVLAGPPVTTDLNGIIDQYGQYTRADWPGKVKSDADLLAQKTTEEADLKAHPAVANRSRWGGWTTGPQRKATGFFHTEQIDGKWWMVDPEGHLFLSVGIDVLRPNLSTTIQGREAMFTNLPPVGTSLASYGDKRTYNFLGANMARKFGAQAVTGFPTRAVTRLKSWGFNTIGNWSPEEIGQQHQFPYVVAMGTKGGFATVPGHRGGKMPDPFDPAFAADVEANVAPKADKAKNDPACLGYFFDNELPWGMPNIDTEHYVLCNGALSLDGDSPAKQAFIEMLKGRYPSIEQFNTAWKTTFASWDDLKAPYNVGGIKSDAQRQDFSAFLSLYADKYFEVVSQAIKRHDPNHLYLGCRFAFWFTPEAVKSAAKYAGVISFNIYNWNRNDYAFAENLGKPCMVGEFHFGATDRGMFSGNVTVKDQQTRGERYASYVQDVLSEPGFVGCHWFQFYDEPTTGRDQDGENFNIGFASITDTPYSELIAAARGANANIYQWHTAAK